MFFPLSFFDFGLWLAAMALILLATSELLNYSPEYNVKYNVDKKLFRFAAIGCGLAFAVIVALHISQVF
jgi:hypothetical protein